MTKQNNEQNSANKKLIDEKINELTLQLNNSSTKLTNKINSVSFRIENI